MSRRLRATQQTELGEEVQCAKCRDFWPADSEFYYFHGGKPHSWCKACYHSDPKVIAKRQRQDAKRRAQKRSGAEPQGARA